MESQYGLLSPNSWYKIIITKFLVFLIPLRIKALLTLNYEKLLELRKTNAKHEIIDEQDMHQFNPTEHDAI